MKVRIKCLTCDFEHGGEKYGAAKRAVQKLEPLIRDYLCGEDSENTTELIKRLRPVRGRGYMTLEELENEL